LTWKAVTCYRPVTISVPSQVIDHQHLSPCYRFFGPACQSGCPWQFLPIHTVYVLSMKVKGLQSGGSVSNIKTTHFIP
jgi:hypothetical protein